eukprot:390727-Alexandrium_andersonii.AAC.1
MASARWASRWPRPRGGRSPGQPASAGATGGRKTAQGKRTARRTQPVSYTHLRAHETSAHL